MTKIDPQTNWDEKWKALLQNSDGSINLEQLKLELADFEDLINRMTSLTYEVTGGLLSKPTYLVGAIIDAKERYEEHVLDSQKKDDKEEGKCSFCYSDLD